MTSVRTRCWSNHLLRNWPTGCYLNCLAVKIFMIFMSCEAGIGSPQRFNEIRDALCASDTATYTEDRGLSLA